MRIALFCLILSFSFSTLVIFNCPSEKEYMAKIKGKNTDFYFKVSDGYMMELEAGNYYIKLWDKDYSQTQKFIFSKYFKVKNNNDVNYVELK